MILMQPEVDREELRDLLMRLANRVTRTTIYTTPNNAGWAALATVRTSTPFGTKLGDTLEAPNVDVIEVLGEPAFASTDYFPDGLIPWRDIRLVLEGIPASERVSLSPRLGGWHLRSDPSGDPA